MTKSPNLFFPCLVFVNLFLGLVVLLLLELLFLCFEEIQEKIVMSFGLALVVLGRKNPESAVDEVARQASIWSGGSLPCCLEAPLTLGIFCLHSYLCIYDLSYSMCMGLCLLVAGTSANGYKEDIAEIY